MLIQLVFEDQPTSYCTMLEDNMINKGSKKTINDCKIYY